MKTLVSLLSIFFILNINAQESNVPALIKLKSGETIDIYHFGQLNCSNAEYFDSFIMLKGNYEGDHTQLKDYSEVSKMVLSGFKEGPAASEGNETGEIVVYRKDGITVVLQNAELALSCYGSVEKYNQIRVQMINPLTKKKFEKVIDVNNINTILFK